MNRHRTFILFTLCMAIAMLMAMNAPSLADEASDNALKALETAEGKAALQQLCLTDNPEAYCDCWVGHLSGNLTEQELDIVIQWTSLIEQIGKTEDAGEKDKLLKQYDEILLLMQDNQKVKASFEEATATCGIFGRKNRARLLDGGFAAAISTVTMAYAKALVEDENAMKAGWKLEEPITVGDWTFDVRAVCHENGAPGGPPVWIKAVSGPVDLDPALYPPGTEFERTFEVCPE